METKVIEILKKRRSIYNIGKNVPLSDEDIVTLVKEVVKESPSSFNSQTSRAVVLMGDEHLKFWDLTQEIVLSSIPEGQDTAPTIGKMDSFRAGYGTVLFFEDYDVVKGLQESFPLYAANFPVWAEQSSGIASMSVWAAFAENNIGASLQHYNPLIDEKVAETWGLPKNWVLRGQMPFGSIEAPAGEKEYMDDEERFRVFK